MAKGKRLLERYRRTRAKRQRSRLPRKSAWACLQTTQAWGRSIIFADSTW